MKLNHYKISSFLIVLLFNNLLYANDIIQAQIKELKNRKDFISNNICDVADKELIEKQFTADLSKLIDALELADLLFHTSISIKKSQITEYGENSIIYNSNKLNHTPVKRYGVRISTSGLVSDNSSITVGTKYFLEEFTVENNKVEVKYRKKENTVTLMSLTINYPDELYVEVDYTSTPHSFRVVGKHDYINYRLHVVFDPFEVKKLNFISVSYQSKQRFLQRLNRTKTDYENLCFDKNGDFFSPKVFAKTSIEPTIMLLWYEGVIDKYPIKAMLKTTEPNETETYTTYELAYAYDKHKQWIFLQDMYEPNDGINGFEKINDIEQAQWNMPFILNSTLTGDWTIPEEKILPIRLNPTYKNIPDCQFNIDLINELHVDGSILNQYVQALTISYENRQFQRIVFERNPSLSYFDLTYVDANYDSYLDLVVNNNIYLYNAKEKQFNAEPLDFDFIPAATELTDYNIYNKSIMAHTSRSSHEFKVQGETIVPYRMSTSYFDEEDNLVSETHQFINGEWKKISSNIEKMDDN